MAEAELEKDEDNFILAELNSLCVCPVSLDVLTFILHEGYSDQFQTIASYLTTLQKPRGITSKEFYLVKK